MDQRPEGWVVLYSEGGGEYSLAVDDSEGNACAYVLARVTRDDHVFFELVTGPAPAATADEEFEDWLRRRGTTCSDLDPADWKSDNISWVVGHYWRRYFVRITVARRLGETSCSAANRAMCARHTAVIDPAEGIAVHNAWVYPKVRRLRLFRALRRIDAVARSTVGASRYGSATF